MNKPPFVISIDVGTGGHWGPVLPQDFAINKEVPFFILENAPFSKERVLSKRRAPKFEMLPTSLAISPLLECQKSPGG